MGLGCYPGSRKPRPLAVDECASSWPGCRPAWAFVRCHGLCAWGSTFIPTRRGWLYLAVIMDLYSRMIVGWSMGERNSAELVEDAVRMAAAHRRDIKGVLLHSDQSVQYASGSYQRVLNDLGIMCSMSRKGNCWDNAPMESFFHSLKTEWVGFEDYKTRSEARASIFSYIELFYNRKRRHSAIGYQSPMAYEKAMIVP